MQFVCCNLSCVFTDINQRQAIIMIRTEFLQSDSEEQLKARESPSTQLLSSLIDLDAPRTPQAIPRAPTAGYYLTPTNTRPNSRDLIELTNGDGQASGGTTGCQFDLISTSEDENSFMSTPTCRYQPPPPPPPEKEPEEVVPQPIIAAALDGAVCGGCKQNIKERFLLKVADEHWHESCLICSMCNRPLSSETSCFFRDNNVYCKTDYRNVYSSKCGRCYSPVAPNEMVFRCLSAVYHLTCFTCGYCGQQLQKGDHYTIWSGQLVCAHDYEILIASNFGESNRKTPKRPRTILNSSQRRAFKASFEQSAKPCRKVRETLAKETGLSVRVVQVWFQNQRAKIKKIQRKHEMQKLQEARKHEAAGMMKKDSGSDASSDKPILSPDDKDSDSDVSSDDEDSYLDSATPIDKLYSMQDHYFYS